MAFQSRSFGCRSESGLARSADIGCLSSCISSNTHPPPHLPLGSDLPSFDLPHLATEPTRPSSSAKPFGPYSIILQFRQVLWSSRPTRSRPQDQDHYCSSYSKGTQIDHCSWCRQGRALTARVQFPISSLESIYMSYHVLLFLK